MKVWIAVMAALVVAGCSSSGSDSSPPTSASPTRSTAAYLAAVRPLYPSSNTDDDLLQGGEADCNVLEAGGSAAQLVDQMGGTTLDTRRATAKKTVTAAIQYLCPAYRDSLPLGD